MKQNLTLAKLLLVALLLVAQPAGFAKEATASQAEYIIDEAIRSVKTQGHSTATATENKKNLNLSDQNSNKQKQTSKTAEPTLK